MPSGAIVEKLLVCPLYAAIQTNLNKIYCKCHQLYIRSQLYLLVVGWGVFSFADRMQAFESGKKRSHEDSTQKLKDITIGSEVRTRAIPIYAHGSVGISFVNSVPLVC